MALLASISKLKKTVLHCQDLSEAWTEFFGLSSMPQFLHNSRPSHLESLGFILDEIYKAMAPDGAGKLHVPLALRCGDTDFYHGPLIIDGRPGSGTFLYFDDAGVGMAILAKDAKNTEFCRFTAKVLKSPHCFVPATGNGEPTNIH